MKNFDMDAQWKMRRLLIDLLRRQGREDLIARTDVVPLVFPSCRLTRQEIGDRWRQRLSVPKNRRGPVCLDLSIPFCRQQCAFCATYKWPYRRYEELVRYLEILYEEMAAMREIFKGEPLRSLDVCGGASDILTNDDAGRLLREIRQAFCFEDQAVRTFESNGRDLAPDRFAVLADGGINRILFGIETRDPVVLRHVHREYFDAAQFARTVARLQQGRLFHVLSADLMIGLQGDSVPQVLEDLEWLAGLGLDTIQVYPLSPTPEYLAHYVQQDLTVFETQLRVKLDAFDQAAPDLAARYGYEFQGGGGRDPRSFRLAARLPEGLDRIFCRGDDFVFDSLGFGADMWSVMTGRVYYRRAGWAQSDMVTRDYEGIELAPEDAGLFYVLKNLSSRGRVLRSSYRACTGGDLCRDFAVPVRMLQDRKMIRVDADEIRLLADSSEHRMIAILLFVQPARLWEGVRRSFSPRAVDGQKRADGRD